MRLRGDTAPPAGTAAIAGRDIHLVIDGHHILDSVGIEVGRGEFMAVIGPNGAGKTSLINVLSGATRATSGTVHLLGRDVTGRRRTAGRAPASAARSRRRTCSSDGASGRTPGSRPGRAGPASSATPPSSRGGGEAWDRADEALALVGLDRLAGRPASTLSHGDRRKLELATVLAQGSEAILLDEPMAGVNIDDVRGLVDLVQRVHRTQAKTIVMIEHHMNVVLDLADRIAVMHHGALVACGSPEEIIASEIVQTVYMGEPL
ncbi:ABC transporter ATP-binding protein [Actinomadura madurae]|uniref:ABC transporter ATP-binding protein n=1 Tax=Actinomadura madurae TaxID=1993 RepID=UPI0020D20B0F|nr:ATP-binding cassette domain-containing protein [Actinomadura madurae]MCP9981165.1 ATP-binding cassette domain-containing protein [Actinomadura madurae]